VGDAVGEPAPANGAMPAYPDRTPLLATLSRKRSPLSGCRWRFEIGHILGWLIGATMFMDPHDARAPLAAAGKSVPPGGDPVVLGVAARRRPDGARSSGDRCPRSHLPGGQDRRAVPTTSPIWRWRDRRGEEP